MAEPTLVLAASSAARPHRLRRQRRRWLRPRRGRHSGDAGGRRERDESGRRKIAYALSASDHARRSVPILARFALGALVAVAIIVAVVVAGARDRPAPAPAPPAVALVDAASAGLLRYGHPSRRPSPGAGRPPPRRSAPAPAVVRRFHPPPLAAVGRDFVRVSSPCILPAPTPENAAASAPPHPPHRRSDGRRAPAANARRGASPISESYETRRAAFTSPEEAIVTINGARLTADDWRTGGGKVRLPGTGIYVVRPTPTVSGPPGSGSWSTEAKKVVDVDTELRRSIRLRIDIASRRIESRRWLPCPARVGRYVVSELSRAPGAATGTDPKPHRGDQMISAAMAGGDDRDEIRALRAQARVSAKLQHRTWSRSTTSAPRRRPLPGHGAGRRRDAHQRMARTQFPIRRRQAADALGAAHDAGIIHRDVKPGNIMLTRQGVLKVADFGVAKAVGEKTDLTRTGMMVGSPAYMSPEQVKGMSLDGRSDLFSLGVVSSDLLHRKPFPADTVTTLVYQILHEDPMRRGDPGRGVDRSRRAHPLGDGEGSRAADPGRATRARAIAWQAPGSSPKGRFDRRDFRDAGAGGPGGQAAPKGAATRARCGGVAQAGAGPAPKSKAGLYVGVAAALAVIGVAGALFFGRSAPAPEAADAGAEAPAVQVEATERPVFDPTGAVEPPVSDLTVAEPPSDEASPEALAAAAAAKKAAQEKKAKAAAAAEAEAKAEAEAQAKAEAEAAAAAAAETAAAEPAGFAVPAEVTETYETKRAVQFRIKPETTLITINGAKIGNAGDWDNIFSGKAYTFPGAGDYYIELTADGYQTVGEGLGP
jgi:serine/threonine-protein kinase